MTSAVMGQQKKKEKKNEKSKKKKLHTHITYNPYVNAFELRPICYPESHYLHRIPRHHTLSLSKPLTKITHLKNVHVSLLRSCRDHPRCCRTARPGLKCNLLECVSHEILAPNLHCFPTINISCSLKQRFVLNIVYTYIGTYHNTTLAAATAAAVCATHALLWDFRTESTNRFLQIRVYMKYKFRR